jgi:hypothetical protein
MSKVIAWLEKVLCTHDHIRKVEGAISGEIYYVCVYCDKKINSKHVKGAK